MTRRHLYLSFWITPWSWTRPSYWHSNYGPEWTLCFGFGQLEYLRD